MSDEAVIEAEDLVVRFPIAGGLFRRTVGHIHAVEGVSLKVHRGETLGLVGESGCGKSTTGRALMRMIEPTSGTIRINGVDVTDWSRSQLRSIRSDLQIVFQDPYSSLSTRMTVHDIIAEPLKVHGKYGRDGRARVGELMETVGLSPEHGNRYAKDFSGGQRQRIGIARALALGPRALILDEPVSALDVSIQAQIVNMLEDLQAEQGLAYLFIAHDLSVVSHLSDRVAVMYLGKIVEIGSRDDVYLRPLHPYTHSLLSSVPVTDPDDRGQLGRIILKGDVPSPADPPSGCGFRTRCWKAEAICATTVPKLTVAAEGHEVACHFPEEYAPIAVTLTKTNRAV